MSSERDGDHIRAPITTPSSGSLTTSGSQSSVTTAVTNRQGLPQVPVTILPGTVVVAAVVQVCRYPGVDPAVRGARRRGPAVPPGEGGAGICPLGIHPGQRLQEPGPARRHRSATDAGNERHIPGLAAGARPGRGRAGDRVAIAAYLGSSDRFDQAIADFAETYADQNSFDHAALIEAIAGERVTAQSGI